MLDSFSSMLKVFVRRLLPEELRSRLWRYRKDSPILYVLRFGLIRGLLIYKRLRCRQGTCTISVPQCRTPILIRLDTTDVDIFKEVFVREAYRTPPRVASGSPGLIIDGGANIGLSSLYFANCFPDAQIIAVEPEQSNYALLKRNCEAYPNVKCLCSAIWSSNVPLRISNPEAEKWMFQMEPVSATDANVGVTAVTIPQLLQSAKSERIGILKLDIEGAEKELFEADSSWVSAVDCMMIELHEAWVPGCTESLRRAVSPFSHTHKEQQDVVVIEFQR